MIIACLLLFLFYFFDLQFSITRILLTYCKPLLCFLLGFPCSSAGKGSACNVRDLGSIPGLGRSPGGGHGNPLPYSCLENPHGQRILAGYSPWGRKESGKTERLSTEHTKTSLLARDKKEKIPLTIAPEAEIPRSKPNEKHVRSKKENKNPAEGHTQT